ncbi:MAG: hypothetical protein OIN66_00935 [Candidatus Methanoperedens sp.]|nr:hypothetical protein [Candidatus Methanoperedens sp.]
MGNPKATLELTFSLYIFFIYLKLLENFNIERIQLTCPARTTGELIRYLDSRPNQKAISSRLLLVAKNHTEKRTAMNKKIFALIMQMPPW